MQTYKKRETFKKNQRYYGAKKLKMPFKNV